MIRIATFGTILAFLAGCASNPPPRPMPQPATQPTSQRGQAQQPEPTAKTAGRRVAADPSPAREAPAQPGQSTEPPWYRQGAYEVGGREHRAFSVTAGDVRKARSQAMHLAYQAYPQGAVAAHEAVRQADGSWKFYVLMAAGG